MRHAILAALLAGCAIQIPAEAAEPPCWAIGETRRMVATYEAAHGALEPEQTRCVAIYRYLEAGGEDFRAACNTCGPREDCALPANGCSYQIDGVRVIVLHELAWDPERVMRHEVMHHIQRCTGQGADVEHESWDWALTLESAQTAPSPGCVLEQAN